MRAIEVALDDGQRTWSTAELNQEVDSLVDRLKAQRTRVLATLMDNSPAWVVADLAAAQTGVVHVPLPLFFTGEQITHVLRAAGVDTVLALAALAARWPQAPSAPCAR